MPRVATCPKERSFRVTGLNAQGLRTTEKVVAYTPQQAKFKAVRFKGLVIVMDARPM